MIKIVLCLSVLLTVPIFGENQDVGILADLEPVRQHQEPLYSDESKENEKPDPGHAKFFFDQDYSYEEDDDDWFYERVDPPDITDTEDKMVPEIDPPPRPDSNSSLQSQEMKEGVMLKEDLHMKKVLPGPKGTIILYTVLVVILIACIVLFSVWKSPLKNGRPLLQPTTVRAGEDERKKRLLDHPFV